MSLIDAQFSFVVDLIKLFSYLVQNGIKFTLGEAWRPDVTQEYYYNMGLSRTKERGSHGKRLAIDLNFFINNEYIGTLINSGKMTLKEAKQKLQHIGDYWESIHPKNRWGGNYKTFIDIPHFERLADEKSEETE